VDYNAHPKYETPLWNETRWNGCWNPDEGVGLYIHAGRFRKDLDLWWIQTVAYLPDGQLAVERSWSRSSHNHGVGSDTLDLTMTDTGWTSTFDGVAELTTTAALSRAPRGSSAPSVPVRWTVTATAASPVWDMYGTVADKQDFAADLHVQQGLHTTGSLFVGDREYSLEGVGFKDHSSGARTWERWHSHRFTLAVMPDYTLHAVVVGAADGQERPPFGAIFRGDAQEGIQAFELPALADAVGGPVEQDMLVTTTSGEQIMLRAELVHALPITITEDNDNINGIDWEIDGDPIVLIEGIARLRAPDGSVGYAFLERSARRSALTRPAEDRR